ncbi:MAG TPA: hypothetical protein VFW27_00880 [Actinoplanes sp.]|nr:hypothetical protein [Actinoplanes sp.]
MVATKVRFGDGLNRRGLGRKHILGIIPWSPLRGGWLTGKFRSGDRPGSS